MWPSNRPSRSFKVIQDIYDLRHTIQLQERNHATTKEVAHILLGPCPTSLTIKWTVSSTGKVGVKLGQSLIHVLRNCIKKTHSVWPTILSKTYKNVLPKLFNWVHTTIHSADKFLKVTHNLWHTLFMTTSTWRLGDFNILWNIYIDCFAWLTS